MIVICGCPRSGTSLICQILDLLGVPMAAPKFIDKHDRIKQFNENGYYELDIEEGIKDDRYKGKAMKLFGYALSTTPKELIDKLICIERKKMDAVKSYEKLRQFMPYSSFTSEQIYDHNKELIDKNIDENTLILRLEWVTKYPKLAVLALCTYLEINPSDKQFNSAVKNIKSCQ